MQKEQISVLAGRKWRYTCLVIIALAVLNGPVNANEIDPYTVEIDVDDRSQGALNRVLPQALDAVLVKLSGQRQASAFGGFNTELKDWIERYGYRSYKLASTGVIPTKGLRAVISFQPGPVDHARTTLGLPSWTGERPRVALWVAVDYSGERSYLPEGADYARFVLADNASKRGVFLQMPVTTEAGELLEDAPEIADVWGGFTEQLSDTAKSLGADITLLAAATNRMGGWQIRWNLSSQHEAATFTSVAESLDEALAEGFNLAIDSIAAATAIAVDDQGQWREFIDVLHLPDAAAFQKLMLDIKQQRLIESVQIESASSQKVRLILVMNTSPQIVWTELDSNAHLGYIGDGVGGVAAVFEYQP